MIDQRLMMSAWPQKLIQRHSTINQIITTTQSTKSDVMEKRTARLTVLVDPQKKAAFEKLCEQEDVTSSQKIRQFMRDYIEQALGADWKDQVFDGED